MMELGTSPMLRRYMPCLTTALLTHQRFSPYGFGKPFKGHPSNTKSSAKQSNPLTIGGSMLKSCDTVSLTKPFSTTRPSLTSHTPSSPQLSHPNFNPLLSWKQHNFPTGFHIWQCPLVNLLMSKSTEHESKDMDVHTKEGCDVIDLTLKDSSSDDEEL